MELFDTKQAKLKYLHFTHLLTWYHNLIPRP